MIKACCRGQPELFDMPDIEQELPGLPMLDALPALPESPPAAPSFLPEAPPLEEPAAITHQGLSAVQHRLILMHCAAPQAWHQLRVKPGMFGGD